MKKTKKRGPKVDVTDRVLDAVRRFQQNGQVVHVFHEPLTVAEELALAKLASVYGFKVAFSNEDEKQIVAFEPSKLPKKHSAISNEAYPPQVIYNPVYREIWAALHKLNRNFVQVNIGPTGSGKSYGGLRTCYDIDPEFDVDNVFFSPKELLERIMDDDLRKGEAHLWDEVGVSINARRFWSLKNLITSYIVQTFRFKNTYLVETVPSFDLVDSQVRKLVHGVMQFYPRTERNPKARATFYFVSYNPRDGKIYYIRPRIVTDKYRFVIKVIQLAHPPQDLAKRYEQKKKKYLHDFYKQLMEMAKALETAEDAGGEKQAKLANALDEVLSNIHEYVDKDGVLRLSKLRVKYKLSWADYSWLRNAVLDELEAQGRIEKYGRKVVLKW